MRTQSTILASILALAATNVAFAGEATSESYSLLGASFSSGGVPSATALSSGNTLGSSLGVGASPGASASSEFRPGFWPIVVPEPTIATGLAVGFGALAARRRPRPRADRRR